MVKVNGPLVVMQIISLVIFLGIPGIFFHVVHGGKTLRVSGNVTFNPENNEGSYYAFPQTTSANNMSSLNSEQPQNGELPQQVTAAASPQPRVVSCKGCGANNIIKSDEAKCEYCGGYLT